MTMAERTTNNPSRMDKERGGALDLRAGFDRAIELSTAISSFSKCDGAQF